MDNISRANRHLLNLKLRAWIWKMYPCIAKLLKLLGVSSLVDSMSQTEWL